MSYISLNLDKSLEFATFCIRVVGAVGDDDMIHELDAHEVACLLETLGQVVVGLAGPDAARGVVMADGDDGGVGEYGLADDDADVDSDL